jgi:hypothetical protein
MKDGSNRREEATGFEMLYKMTPSNTINPLMCANNITGMVSEGGS